ncbi:MAG: TIGR03905 family TSCPD domain-containing protein [Clostridia bacterium]|nr:TIGR03905 family TSCPD domain-containing protein [Clostridia bacterium]
MQYQTHGVCSRMIEIELEGTKVQSVRFLGGCSGNTQGVAALVSGMEAEEAIRRLSGIKCGFKPTSCPDQLAKALEKALQEA